MGNPGSLLAAIGIPEESRAALHRLSTATGISVDELRYYDRYRIMPVGRHCEVICREAGITEVELALRMGVLNRRLTEALSRHATEISRLVGAQDRWEEEETPPTLAYQTEFGRLYRGDCIELARTLEDQSVDLVFADPPFNLKKLYPSKINDDLKEQAYLRWCEEWLAECIRVLRYGGSLFLWNLPKWNTSLAEFLNNRLTFRHWIAVDIKYSLPIPGRLYPSHYSLLYFTKGEKANAFHPDRLPMEICPHCYGDLRDYGGYKDKMNPAGVNLTDVWYDIPPVRHTKYKKREGANELAIQLMDRIIEMATNTGDLVFDPFGGAGTTYAVAEIKQRRWIGVEIGPVDEIITRLRNIRDEAERLTSLRAAYNQLFTPASLAEREKRGLWTCESVRNGKADGQVELPFVGSSTK